jgi:glycine betaine transporter
MLGVCYSLVKQLRDEPVVSTAPPGVRTVVAKALHPADQPTVNGERAPADPRRGRPPATGGQSGFR